MTKFYLLIIAGKVIDEQSRFYKIAIGSGAADAPRLHALKVLASSQNWYFRPYTHEVAEFLLRVAISMSRMPDELLGGVITAEKFLSAWKKFSKLQCSGQHPINKPTSGRKQALNQRFKPPKQVLQTAECVARSKPKFRQIHFIEYLHTIYQL